MWQDAMYRLVRNKAAMVGLGVIILAGLMAIFAPFIAPYSPTAIPNAANPTINADPFWTGTKYVDPRYLFGTDEIGRDILTRLIYSARVSMIIGFVPVALIFLIGVSVGMVAGYAGGWTDQLLMRITDVVYAFPDLLFLLIIMATLRGTDIGKFGGGLPLMFVGIAIVNWVGMARLLRGQVLSLKEKEFVEAARCVGATPIRILVRHLFPNAIAPAIVAVSFAIPSAMLTEATLSFLGIGVIPPTPTWGVMINDGFVVFSTSPWPVLLPAFCIAIVMLSFTFLGDGLRDALDPRMKI
ncbi:MAG: ABC transporter permease [Chloroflexota bacterium]|nr:ABC transporter permease [Chloroflexota bacterium]MDE3192337.1 ABC transporter permease [Chloroflexota bacterium]